MEFENITETQLKVKQKFEQMLRYLMYENASVIEIKTGIRFTKYYLNIAPSEVKKLDSYKSDFAVLTEKCSNVEFCVEGDRICIFVQNEDFNEKNLTYKSLVNSLEYKNSNKTIPIPVGFDFYGNIVISDLKDLAYLMCVGFVGSGISEFIEGVILSLTTKFSPSEFKLLLVESKNYSLKTLDVFSGLPHVLGGKIYKTETEIFSAFDDVIKEINHRNDILTEMGFPSVDLYNKSELVKSHKKNPIPNVLIIINKFENVISLNQAKVEKYIQQLTGKARACGVNLIICSEKPTDDVLTKVVLRHITSKLVFKTKIVSSKYLSILPESEFLFNNGDMYFLPYTEKIPMRLQYGYVKYEDCRKDVDEIISKYQK